MAGHPSIPTPAPLPTQTTAQVQQAAEAERQRMAAAQGQQSTILGGLGSGQQQNTNQAKTLLGQ